MVELNRLMLWGVLVVCNAPVIAEESNGIVYFGVGSAQSGDPNKTSATPKSVGFIALNKQNDFLWGLDVGAEGTFLDSTWGQNKAVSQSTSFNLLLGKNLTAGDETRFDAAFLIGARKVTSECPKSYLGYQCYANQEPSNKYDVNYGAVVTWSYKNVMLGLRVTGESAQTLFGIRF